MKNYKNIKIKNYLKNYSLLIVINNMSQNSKNRVVKQNLTKLNLNLYKIYNRLTKKMCNKSIYKNYIKLIYNLLSFLVPKKHFFNISVLKNLKILKFFILGIKINKKIYLITQIKNLQISNYKNSLSIFYQFLVINLKFIQTFE